MSNNPRYSDFSLLDNDLCPIKEIGLCCWHDPFNYRITQEIRQWPDYWYACTCTCIWLGKSLNKSYAVQIYSYLFYMMKDRWVDCWVTCFCQHCSNAEMCCINAENLCRIKIAQNHKISNGINKKSDQLVEEINSKVNKILKIFVNQIKYIVCSLKIW